MDETPRIEYRYIPRRCAFLNRTVWAIVTQQTDGRWRIVNCLDKDQPCFGTNCVFTTDCGEWPFAGLPNETVETRNSGT